MKKILILCILVLSISAVLPLEASEIFGKISYKGSPLKNAEISINGKLSKTNDLGFYSVNIDPGSYELKLKLPDGTSRDMKVDVFPQSTEKNLKLE